MDVVQNGKEKLWTKSFIFTCLAGFFCNISIQMLNTTLAPFANDLWNSKTLGGLLTSFFNIGSIAMAFFAGVVANRIGKRNTLFIAAVMFGLPTFLMAFVPIPGVCLGVRVLQGMAKGILTVAAAAIVTEVAPKSRITEALGLYGLGNTLAFAVGPYIGLATAEKTYKDMFILCASLFLIGGFIVLFVTYEKHLANKHLANKENASSATSSAHRGIWKLIEKKALMSGVNYSICFASTACVLIYIATYSKEVLRYNSSQICMFYLFAAISMVLIRFFGGRIADKQGPLVMIVPGHVAILSLLLIMASGVLKSSFPLYLICGACYGVATAATMPAMNAMAVLYSPSSRNNEANATFGFVMDFGILAVSLTFGSIIEGGASVELGYRTAFLISTVIASVSLAMSVVLYNKKAREKAIANRENA